jgi:hypothetical protein
VRSVQNAAEGYLQQAEDDDVRRVLVENQKLRASYVDAMREAELTGAPLEPIRAKFEEDLSRVGEGLATRRGTQAAEQHGVVSRSVVSDAERVIGARRMGRQLSNQAKEFDAAAAAQMQADPTILDRILAERNALLDTYAGRVPPELIDKAKAEGRAVLTASSVMAVIETEPETAEQLLRNPKHEPWGALTPEQRASLINAAQAAVNTNKAKAAEAERERRVEMAKRGDDAMNEMLQLQANGQLSQFNTNALLRRTDIDPDRRLQILSVFRALAKPPKLDAQAANDAYTDIFRSETDPRRIKSESQIDALLTDGRVDPSAHRSLRAAFASREKPEAKLENFFMSRVDSIINPKDALGRIMAPDGPLQAYKFRRELQFMRESWTKDPNKDPDALFDPSSKEYQRYTLPLVNKYRATTVFVPDEKGVMKPSAVAQPTDALPLVGSEADYRALPAGSKYRDATTPAGKFKIKPAGTPSNSVTGTIRGPDGGPINTDSVMPQ